MKNYKLYSLRLAKTGVVFGVNKFNQTWIEFWFKGTFKVVQLKFPNISNFLYTNSVYKTCFSVLVQIRRKKDYPTFFM